MLLEDLRLIAGFTVIFVAYGLFIMLRADQKSAALTNALVPIIFLGFSGIKMRTVPPQGLSAFETLCLGGIGAGLLCSAFAFAAKAPRKNLLWVAWTINSALGAWLVYLAFFFKIF